MQIKRWVLTRDVYTKAKGITKVYWKETGRWSQGKVGAEEFSYKEKEEIALEPGWRWEDAN